MRRLRVRVAVLPPVTGKSCSNSPKMEEKQKIVKHFGAALVAALSAAPRCTGLHWPAPFLKSLATLWKTVVLS